MGKEDYRPYSKVAQLEGKQTIQEGEPVRDWIPRQQALIDNTGKVTHAITEREHTHQLNLRRRRRERRMAKRAKWSQIYPFETGLPVSYWLPGYSRKVDTAYNAIGMANRNIPYSQEGRADLEVSPDYRGTAQLTVKPNHPHYRKVRRSSGEPATLTKGIGVGVEPVGTATVPRSNNVTIFRFEHDSKHDQDFPVAMRTSPAITQDISPVVPLGILPAGMQNQVINARRAPMEERIS